MAGVRFEAGIRDPAHVLVLLQPGSQGNGIACMSFSAQTQSLQTKQKLLSGKRIQCRSEVTKDLNPNTNSEGDRSECFPEIQSVVALGRFGELGESVSVLTPIKFTAVNNNAANGGSMTTNPLGCAVDDDVSTVVDGAEEVTASSESVVNLE